MILDINMPRMSGLELLRKIREDAELRNLIVFVLTTSNDEQDKFEAYDLNVAGYMLKSDIGGSFMGAVSLVDQYWRVVEFPQAVGVEDGLTAPQNSIVTSTTSRYDAAARIQHRRNPSVDPVIADDDESVATEGVDQRRLAEGPVAPDVRSCRVLEQVVLELVRAGIHAAAVNARIDDTGDPDRVAAALPGRRAPPAEHAETPPARPAESAASGSSFRMRRR